MKKKKKIPRQKTKYEMQHNSNFRTHSVKNYDRILIIKVIKDPKKKIINKVHKKKTK